jgi:hypothetical protein
MHLLTNEVPIGDIPLSLPGLLPHAHFVAMAVVYLADSDITSCSSEDEEEQPEHHCCIAQVGADPPCNAGRAADRTLNDVHPTGFPNLTDEIGPVILTQGDLS